MLIEKNTVIFIYFFYLLLFDLSMKAHWMLNVTTPTTIKTDKFSTVFSRLNRQIPLHKHKHTESLIVEVIFFLYVKSYKLGGRKRDSGA